MASLALLFSTHVPVPTQLPAEPPRRTPYDQAVLDHDGASGQPFPLEADHPDPFGGQPPRDAALTSLLGYRGLAFTPVRRPAGLAFLASSPKPDAFDLGAARKDELGRLHDVVHAYGGDGLALWTCGQAVHAWAARSPAPGARPGVLHLHLPVDAALPGARPPESVDGLCAWLEGSPLAPDARALREALAAPVLPVPAFFAAFGVAGANEPQVPDPLAAWEAFAQAADALLRGEAPPPAARKVVNALVADTGSQLPAKPAARRGATAMRVAAAHAALREVLGEPVHPRVAACAAAAALFDAVTSGPAAGGLLHAASKRADVGLAIGRLLTHFPVAVRRDPLFLALAAHEAEVWNGHFFAGALAALAERMVDAGFSVVVYPAAREAEFRSAHGLRADASAARDGWAGEAAIGGEGLQEAITRWFERAKADGTALQCAPDGTCRVQRFSAGVLVEQVEATDPALVQAARRLDPRAALLAAGFPDVLAPGELARKEAESLEPAAASSLPATSWPPEPGVPDPRWVPPRVLLQARNLYATADLSRLSWYRDQGQRMARELAALYPGQLDGAEPLTPQQALALHDAALRALGFEALGDLLASQYFACALRAYAQGEARAMATVFLLPGRPALGCEIRSRFADGCEAVTTSMTVPWPGRASESRKTGPADLSRLWQAHGQHLAEVGAGRELCAAPATLEEFARRLEP